MTEDQARKTYDRALKVEQEFGEYFTGLCEFNLLTVFLIDRSSGELLKHADKTLIYSCSCSDGRYP